MVHIPIIALGPVGLLLILLQLLQFYTSTALNSSDRNQFKNKGEMMAAVEEDDNIPSPVDTPSIGSVSSTHVADVGNRVLNLIEKHKREIRARMADQEKSFRDMLHQESKNLRGRKHRKHSHDSSNTAETSSSSTTRGSNTLKETFVDAYLTAVRHSEADQSHPALKAHEHRPNVQSVYSDEYFDVPQPHSDGLNQFLSKKTAASAGHLHPKEAVGIKREKDRSNRPAEDMRSRRDQYEQSQKYGSSFSPRVSPKRTSSEKVEAESGLDPVVAEDECRYAPDEHYEGLKDFCNSSSSDDEDDDRVPVSRANNNHVSFQSEYSDPRGNAVRSSSDVNINHDDNDYDTSPHDDDEDSRRSSSNPEANPSQDSLNASSHIDNKSEESFAPDAPENVGLGKPWSKDRVSPRTMLRQEPSSSSSSDIQILSLDEDGPSLWEISWRDISDHWVDYSWQLGVAMVILLLAIGIFIMSSDDLQNPVPERATEGVKNYRLRPKTSRNYGPLL